MEVCQGGADKMEAEARSHWGNVDGADMGSQMMVNKAEREKAADEEVVAEVEVG